MLPQSSLLLLPLLFWEVLLLVTEDPSFLYAMELLDNDEHTKH